MVWNRSGQRGRGAEDGGGERGRRGQGGGNREMRCVAFYRFPRDAVALTRGLRRLETGTEIICPVRLADKPWLKVLLADLL